MTYLATFANAGPRLRALVVALGILVLLTVPASSALAEEEAASGGLFDINWVGIFVWTWLIFALLFFVLRKFAWGPILGALDAREQRIQARLDEAASERAEAEKLLAENRKLLDGARHEAQEILAEGRKAGERLRAELMEEAQRQKEHILERSREEIQQEHDEALATLRREAVDLSIGAASRVLERNVDSKDNRRLVQEYLDSLAEDFGGKKA